MNGFTIDVFEFGSLARFFDADTSLMIVMASILTCK